MCQKGMGSNSVLCNGCYRWVHKRCSGIEGKLHDAVTLLVMFVGEYRKGGSGIACLWS